MRDNGTFNTLAIERVVFGRDAAQVLPEELARIGAKRAFLLVSETLRTQTDEITKVQTALGERCVGVHSGMPSHTPREAVILAANAARDKEADMIVTIGGGSVTDAGKVMQLCLEHNVSTTTGLDDFVTRVDDRGRITQPNIRAPQVRQIAVPTTLSGGEFGMSAGCTDTEVGVKQAFRHPLFVPRVVILDANLCRHTPVDLWRSTGVRAVDHAVETLCSPDATSHSDGPALHALRLLSRALPQCEDADSPADARLNCLLGVWASMDHHQDGTPMGASHGIGHVLGGSCGVPHGHTSCVMLPSVLRWNHAVNADRQALVSEAFGQPGRPAGDVVAEFIAALGMPRSLRDVGVSREQFELVAKHAMHDRYIHSNPRPIAGPQDVLEILSLAAE
ncbi:MAG: iron-containing alcohol dehydrogenase [Gammaproteobacteria bacterium]|nr:iron-containing alcohol dehydrogenase [Gammaproteobacteria bacterium]